MQKDNNDTVKNTIIFSYFIDFTIILAALIINFSLITDIDVSINATISTDIYISQVISRY